MDLIFIFRLNFLTVIQYTKYLVFSHIRINWRSKIYLFFNRDYTKSTTQKVNKLSLNNLKGINNFICVIIVNRVNVPQRLIRLN